MRHDSRMVMLISFLLLFGPPVTAFPALPVAAEARSGAQVGGRWAVMVAWQPLPEVGLRF